VRPPSEPFRATGSSTVLHQLRTSCASSSTPTLHHYAVAFTCRASFYMHRVSASVCLVSVRAVARARRYVPMAALDGRVNGFPAFVRHPARSSATPVSCPSCTVENPPGRAACNVCKKALPQRPLPFERRRAGDGAASGTRWWEEEVVEPAALVTLCNSKDR